MDVGRNCFSRDTYFQKRSFSQHYPPQFFQYLLVSFLCAYLAFSIGFPSFGWYFVHLLNIFIQEEYAQMPLLIISVLTWAVRYSLSFFLFLFCIFYLLVKYIYRKMYFFIQYIFIFGYWTFRCVLLFFAWCKAKMRRTSFTVAAI